MQQKNKSLLGEFIRRLTYFLVNSPFRSYPAQFHSYEVATDCLGEGMAANFERRSNLFSRKFLKC